MFSHIVSTILLSSVLVLPQSATVTPNASHEVLDHPSIVLAVSKTECDRRYQNATRACSKLPGAYNRNVCYRGAASAYATCLALASYGGSGGGGNFGGRSVTVQV